MIGLLDLPVEILYLILDELPRQGRYRMGLTCKDISLLAIPGLYSLCYFDFCLKQETYILSGPVENTTANYLAYTKYHRAIRHLYINNRTCFRDKARIRPSRELENPCLDATRAPSDPMTFNSASISSQFDLLLPKFTALKTIDLRNHEYTSDAALRQIRTIQTILVSCLSLKDLSIQINCDSQVRLLALKALEIGYQPGQDYPRLTDLTIQLTETCYDNNLEPAQHLIDSLCKLLHPSARTVQRLGFGFEVKRLADDWDYNSWYWPPREGRSWPRLDLPCVEAACIDVCQSGLSISMFLEYVYFDPTKVKELRLTNATGEKVSDPTDEGSVLNASRLLLKFPNAEVIQLWPALDATWVHAVFAARSGLGALRELRILIDGLCLLPGSFRFGLLLEVINIYGSEHKAQVSNTPNPCGLFQDVLVIFRF